MADEEKKEEKKEEEPIQKDPNDLVSRANEVAERLEKANAQQAKLLAKQEALAVEKTLGGETTAGESEVEETAEEYTKKVMANEVETK